MLRTACFRIPSSHWFMLVFISARYWHSTKTKSWCAGTMIGLSAACVSAFLKNYKHKTKIVRWRDQCITAGLAQCIITQTLVVFCRVEECKAAYNHSQGLALFGSKIKLTPLDVDGKSYRMTMYVCMYMCSCLVHVYIPYADSVQIPCLSNFPRWQTEWRTEITDRFTHVQFIDYDLTQGLIAAFMLTFELVSHWHSYWFFSPPGDSRLSFWWP